MEPTPNTKYKNKFVQAHDYAETPQLKNVFHLFGAQEINGVKHLGLLQEGAIDQSPTWWALDDFAENFEALDEYVKPGGPEGASGPIGPVGSPGPVGDRGDVGAAGPE